AKDAKRRIQERISDHCVIRLEGVPVPPSDAVCWSGRRSKRTAVAHFARRLRTTLAAVETSDDAHVRLGAGDVDAVRRENALKDHALVVAPHPAQARSIAVNGAVEDPR